MKFIRGILKEKKVIIQFISGLIAGMNTDNTNASLSTAVSSMKKGINKIPKEVITSIYNDEILVVINFITEETINWIDDDGRTLLFHSIISKSINMIDLLLKRGSSTIIQDRLGWSPLHYAAQNNDLEGAKLLIEYGANLECKDAYGNTPLWRAVFSSMGMGDMIQLLLSKGADPGNHNNSDISPIQLANTIANYNTKQFFD